MKKSMFLVIIGFICAFLYLFIKNNPDNNYIIETKKLFNKISNKNEIVSIANPASTYCIKNGGTLEIKNESDGSIGICNFSNGSSCEERAFLRGECKPSQIKEPLPIEIDNFQTNEETTACTMEYAPVCAKVEIQCVTTPCEPVEQTFGNKCMMDTNKLATFLYDGECKTEKADCPLYSQPSPNFCKDGIIEDRGIDENGCQLPPKCLE